jgi:DNA-binding beta-propeller fold protein YncE
VFGQAGSFTSGTPNLAGVSADSLYSPSGIALDALGNLYVTDNGNHRVLAYDAPGLRREVEEWIAADDVVWPFSFVRICDALDLDPRAVRAAVAARLPYGA